MAIRIGPLPSTFAAIRSSMPTPPLMIITNLGGVYSEPILTVTGSGNITLMMGMTIVELENIPGRIVIDSVLQEAYQDTTLINDHMTGEFPVLKPGANAISWNRASLIGGNGNLL